MILVSNFKKHFFLNFYFKIKKKFDELAYSFWFSQQLIHEAEYKKYREEYEQMKNGASVANDENSNKIQLKSPAQRILLTKFFKCISKKGHKLAVKCTVCKGTKVLIGSLNRSSNFSHHLRVSGFYLVERITGWCSCVSIEFGFWFGFGRNLIEIQSNLILFETPILTKRAPRDFK